MYFLLFYDYVENIIERRAPYRELHGGSENGQSS